jgi:hypothetical protein
MPRQWIGRLMVSSMWLVTGTLSAQDSTHKGLVFGLRGPGLFIPVSPTAAVRFQAAATVSTSNGLDFWTTSLGASGVFYRRSWDALRTYIGPGITYTYSWTSNNPARTEILSGSFYFGTEYVLARRFSVFGELGVAYSRTTGSRVGPANDVIPMAPSGFWSLTNGVGLLFRF